MSTETPRYINALEAAAGFRSAKNGIFAEREDIAAVIEYAHKGMAGQDVSFMNVVIGMTVNTLLENVAAMLESAEDEYVERDHTDTAMMIAMILEDEHENTGRAYRNPDIRSYIWLRAKLIDEAWDDLPRELIEANSEPFDIIILPDVIETFGVTAPAKKEDITEFLIKWLTEAQESDK